MNFLNKKHLAAFTNSNSNLGQGINSTKGSILDDKDTHGGSYIVGNRPQINQNTQSSRVKQAQKNSHQNTSNSRLVQRQSPNHLQQSQSYSNTYSLKKSSSAKNIQQTNLCSEHQNQILRHLCLQCNQLLCSQCISEHLQGHRETSKTIPKIETINKLRKQMAIKIQHILQFMEGNNPKLVLPDVGMLKSQVVLKIQQMKEQVIKAFDQWCKILQNHILQDLVKTQQLRVLSDQIGTLKQQVLTLHQQMKNSQNSSVQLVKVIHQIDSEKLQATYLEMFNTFSKTLLKSKFTFDYDWNNMMDSFEKYIQLRPLYPIYPSHQQQDSEHRKSQSNNVQLTLRSPVYNIQNQQNTGQNKLVQIKSVQSLIEPPSQFQIKQKVNLQNNNSQYEREKDRKIQKIFQRQGSHKRLPIFTAQPLERATQQNQKSQVQRNEQ